MQEEVTLLQLRVGSMGRCRAPAAQLRERTMH